ncbi:MAG: hypothetical protein ABSG25_12815, partial [Bryobacteraceae bacterium]
LGNMVLMLRFAVAVCSIVLCLRGAQNPTPPGSDRSKDWLLLYAWQAPACAWNFSLFLGPPCADCNSVEDITDSKRIIRGVDQLKLQMSRLPAGSRVTIAGKAAHGKGVERLEYPPASTLDEITRYAEARGIVVENPWQEYYEVPEWLVLYSWQSSDGDWNFSLLPGFISRLFTMQEITDQKKTLRGVKQLELRLSDCRPRTRVILAGPERVAVGQAAERLGYPPDKILSEIIRYTTTRNIQIDDPRRYIDRR